MVIPVRDFYLSSVNCVLFPCLSPCLGEVGAYERYSVPLEYAANPQPVENKSSIEGAEVEGAMHHGLRNVKNAIVHRPCLGRGRHFTLPLSRRLLVCPGTPYPLSFPISLQLYQLFPTASSCRRQGGQINGGQMTGGGVGGGKMVGGGGLF